MAELVAQKLAAFLAAYEREPWTPGGKVDCCLIIAEWAIWLGHADPAAHLRGSYAPGQGQVDILAANGGAVSLVEHCAISIGAQPVLEPSCGDFGVEHCRGCCSGQTRGSARLRGTDGVAALCLQRRLA